MDDLKQIIRDLINKKKEGVYWDFKETPYESNEDLVKDIICLANTDHDGNRYIVFGVDDNFNIKGVENRKRQSDIIDTLRRYNFANENYPDISLECVEMSDYLLDILVIKNTNKKPYYLTREKKYKKGGKNKWLRAGTIYTRNMDSNTPTDSVASSLDIEKMWKERFGLSHTPLVRIKHLLLDRSDWHDDELFEKNRAYHKLFPEFNIKCDKPVGMHKYESYCYFYQDIKGCIQNFKLQYHSTILTEIECVTLDGSKIVLPAPEIRCVFDEYWFFYYDLSSLKGSLLLFLRKKDGFINFNSGRFGEAPFLVFCDEEALEKFVKFIDRTKFESTDPVSDCSDAQKTWESSQKGVGSIRPNDLLKIKAIYDEWNAHNRHVNPNFNLTTPDLKQLVD